MKDEKTGLTHKELSLADNYLSNNLNATKAYEASEYSQNCSYNCKRVTAYKILQKPHIKAYIAQKLKKTAEKADITVERIAKEIASVAFGELEAKIGLQTNIANKLKALELLGRYRAMFTDNINQADTTREKELGEKEKKQAEKIAQILLDEELNAHRKKNIKLA